MVYWLCFMIYYLFSGNLYIASTSIDSIDVPYDDEGYSFIGMGLGRIGFSMFIIFLNIISSLFHLIHELINYQLLLISYPLLSRIFHSFYNLNLYFAHWNNTLNTKNQLFSLISSRLIINPSHVLTFSNNPSLPFHRSINNIIHFLDFLEQRRSNLILNLTQVNQRLKRTVIKHLLWFLNNIPVLPDLIETVIQNLKILFRFFKPFQTDMLPFHIIAVQIIPTFNQRVQLVSILFL